jgi:hypothetical protein
MTTGESFAMKHTTYDETSTTPKSIIFPTTKITNREQNLRLSQTAETHCQNCRYSMSVAAATSYH